MELKEFSMNTINSIGTVRIADISNLNVELKMKAMLIKNYKMKAMLIKNYEYVQYFIHTILH